MTGFRIGVLPSSRFVSDHSCQLAFLYNKTPDTEGTLLMQFQTAPRFNAWLLRALLVAGAIGGVWTTAVALPATSNAFVRSCPGNPQGTGYGPRNDRDAPNYVSSVRNISCHRAGWGPVEHGRLITSTGNLRTRGWRCIVLKRFRPPGSIVLGANVRCVRGNEAFRWTWGT
jgi:hypothetical protein